MMNESFRESKSNIHQEEKVKQCRDYFDSKTEFIFSVIGVCVGLSNMWRFPYLCYQNGGGVFLIPYLVALLVGGIPMLFMELSLGQMFSIGGLGIWKMCPLFKGVGYASIIMSYWVCVYYIVILAYALYFFTYTFTMNDLEWSKCGHTWNTECCMVKCFIYNDTSVSMINSTCKSCVTPAEEFWNRNVLQLSTGVDVVGNVRTPLLICLFLMWTVCYFSIWKGVKWTGKVVYFTTILPCFVLIILLIRGVTLPGAKQGVVFYLKPDFSKLWKPKIWLDATTQILFSSGIGLGTHIGLGSHNPWKSNCQRDVLIVSLVNTGTSFFCGFIIFSILGYMAYEQGVHVKDVAIGGYGLAFIAYPSAVSTMYGSQIFAGFFYVMIILLGLDSHFCILDGIITAIMDEWPQIFEEQRREIFVVLLCVLSFLLGISAITQGGYYVFNLFDQYSASGYTLLILIFFECISFSWSFGVTRLVSEIERMIDQKLFWWWKICWVALCPCFCFFVFLLSILDFKRVTIGNYNYPFAYELIIGGFMSMSSIIFIPAVMIYYIGFRLHRSRCLYRRPQKYRDSIYSTSTEDKNKADKYSEESYESVTDYREESYESVTDVLRDIFRPNVPINSVSISDIYTINTANVDSY